MPIAPVTRTCPYRAEDVKPEAVVCPHCRKDIRPGHKVKSRGGEATGDRLRANADS